MLLHPSYCFLTPWVLSHYLLLFLTDLKHILASLPFFFTTREFESFILNEGIKIYRDKMTATESPSSGWDLGIIRLVSGPSKIPGQGCSLGLKMMGLWWHCMETNSDSV